MTLPSLGSQVVNNSWIVSVCGIMMVLGLLIVDIINNKHDLVNHELIIISFMFVLLNINFIVRSTN